MINDNVKIECITSRNIYIHVTDKAISDKLKDSGIERYWNIIVMIISDWENGTTFLFNFKYLSFYVPY